MSKINDINDLRDHLINTALCLKEGTIDVQQAVAASKVCDGVINTIKVQLENARLRNEQPDIPFLGTAHNNYIEGKTITRKLSHDK